METFDAIVVGLGAHGSATAAELARRGQRVLGLERFGRGETLGSSSGWTRMIRLIHHERPWLTPLAIDAWEAWRRLEAESGTTILQEGTGLYAGPGDGAIVDGAAASAAGSDVTFEVLDAAEIHRRWPLFELAPDTVGVLESRAGILRADRGIAAHLEIAERHGAVLRFGRQVVDWRPAPGGGFEVEDRDGTVAGAEHLVLTAGAWAAAFVADLGLPLRIERERPMLFEASADAFRLGAADLPNWMITEGGTTYYGFRHDPELGLKISIHHWGDFVDPEAVDRTVDETDVERVRTFIRRRMPAADGPIRHAMVCLYTNTPDEVFVIDRHPAASGVAFASACSGTGYKFAPVVGAILADLVLDGATTRPIDRFRADRFAGAVTRR
jgi:sarcosine oxidase